MFDWIHDTVTKRRKQEKPSIPVYVAPAPDADAKAGHKRGRVGEGAED